MANGNLQSRIEAEFAANEQKLKGFQAEAVQAYEARQERLKTFEKVCQELQEITRPRLETLSEKFGGKMKVTPQVSKGRRTAAMDFQSDLASVKLQFTASTDNDVQKLVLDYNLEVLPILMKFDPHAQAEFPLESVNKDAVGQWIDDRIVDFVRTYLSISHNEYYLKDYLVVDPVANVKFPKFAAGATLERGRETLYFIDEKTRAAYEKQEAAAKGASK